VEERSIALKGLQQREEARLMKVTAAEDTDQARQLCGRGRDRAGRGVEAEQSRETTNCREMQ